MIEYYIRSVCIFIHLSNLVDSPLCMTFHFAFHLSYIIMIILIIIIVMIKERRNCRPTLYMCIYHSTYLYLNARRINIVRDLRRLHIVLCWRCHLVRLMRNDWCMRSIRLDTLARVMCWDRLLW